MIIPKGTVVTIDGKVYRTLEAQVAWNKEELESLDIETLEALPDQFTELQENVSALADSVADVTEDVGDLKSDMTDEEADISNLKGRMTSAEGNISSNAQAIGQLEFDVDQVEGDITALGTAKLNKPTNTGDVGDVIVKTATGTEYQAVAPFNPNGTYPNVTAGKAISAKSLENVSEDSGATQTAPFFFQATATANNTEETPTAPVFELKSIRGNTIVYNQLVDGMTTTYPTISGHTYWAFHSGQPPVIVVSQGTPISFPSPQTDKLVDLTRWFNGSIPQAILDDPTVFPINYYDDDLTYSAGELKNCSCTELTTVGFNQWDEEWESGGLSDGIPYTDATKIRSKNYIQILADTSYYVKASEDVKPFFYDASKTYIGTLSSVHNTTFTTPANAVYLKFHILNTSSYNPSTNPVCINLHWDGERDGTYEPFTSHTYPMEWSGKSAGSAYDEKLPDGTEITRMGSVDLGSLAWTYASVPKRFLSSIPTMNGGVYPTVNGICNRYAYSADVYSHDDGEGIIDSKAFCIYGTYIRIRDDSYTDADALKNALNGVILYFPLATPTTSSGDPYPSVIEGDDYGTMGFDSVVPVGNEFFYPADYSLLIDDLGNYTGYDVTELAKKSDLIPAPVGDGTYTLKAVKSGDTVIYTWEAVS